MSEIRCGKCTFLKKNSSPNWPWCEVYKKNLAYPAGDRSNAHRCLSCKYERPVEKTTVVEVGLKFVDNRTNPDWWECECAKRFVHSRRFIRACNKCCVHKLVS